MQETIVSTLYRFLTYTESGKMEKKRILIEIMENKTSASAGTSQE